MNIFQSIVAVLTGKDILPKDKAAEAVAALNENSKDFTASLVAAVKAEIEADAPPVAEPVETEPVETKSLAEQIAELSGDELQQIQDIFAPSTTETEAATAEVEALKASLAAAEAKATEATEKVTALANQISAARAGRAAATTTSTAPATNGDNDIDVSAAANGEAVESPALNALIAKAKAAGAFTKNKRG